ncbi:hypothetical protein DFJ58DRAFT_917733 [Suillus subalutaceus]|uniref:uncharacterized protein n=1 Tax=Suillus subalutaceus TaxID=48586 RepID=UPI001B85FA62|nr:uncharacterized protein DFJ58DRAFT_917733 [Suillus subalutaceus]KAG1836212.1 hypothetical protein DFJ58DRAFT_917733 [Suillus subalutaceus]
MEPTKQTLLVSGLLVDVYSHPTSSPSSTDPIHALFFLHGSAQDNNIVNTIKVILTRVMAPDRVNHGSRLVDQKRNLAWSEDPAKNNDQHAVDMYTIQTEDVSFIIDHLPSFLYPSGERMIVEWGICGMSLGGHSTWIALSRARPILRHSILPALLPCLLQNIYRNARLPYRAKDASNPFLGKKVLVISGKEDKLVPWVTSAEFVDGLEVGEGGIKRVVVEEGAGHECTSGMLKLNFEGG